MMTIQITRSGSVQRFHVEQIEFVQHCHYLKCGKEFLTIDPDKLYCVTWHQVEACKLRKVITKPPIGGRALSAR